MLALFDLLIADWRRQRQSLVEQHDGVVERCAQRSYSRTVFEPASTKLIKRIAKLDARIAVANELRARYAPDRWPSSAEHASAIAALLAEGGHV